MRSSSELARSRECSSLPHVRSDVPGDSVARRAATRLPRGAAQSFDLAMAASWLEIDQRPRFVLDGADRVLWCNGAAHRGLHPGMLLHIAGDRVVFASREHDEAARRLFHSADTAVQRATLRADTSALQGIALGVWGQGAGADRRVFVKVTLLQPALGAGESGMAARYGLTPAGAGVVDTMLHVDSPAEIANALDVSVHTVRTHIRRIYAKTAVRSQAQLVRLAMVYCGG